MKNQNLIEKLNKINKAFYTIADIELITGQKRPTLRVSLNRLVKSGRLVRLMKNIYLPREKMASPELIALQYNSDSYISFESALSRYGILSQSPYALTLATWKRSKKLTLGSQEIIYRRIARSLYFGFNYANGINTAEPEKALLDYLYLISRGLSALPEAMDLSLINQKKVKIMLKQFPPYVKKYYKLIQNR